MVEPLLDDRAIQMSTLKYKIKDKRDIQNPNHVKVVTDRAGFAIYFPAVPSLFAGMKGPMGSITNILGSTASVWIS